MKLVDRLVRQFAMAFNTLLTVTLHVIAPNCGVFGIFLHGFDILICANQLREQFQFFQHNVLIDLCCSLNTTKNT